MRGRGRRSTGLTSWLGAATCAGAVLASGCTDSRNVASDPLLGRSNAIASTRATPSSTPIVPPLPTPNVAGSNAALAGGMTPTMDGRHSLQIEDPRPASGQSVASVNPAGGTVLQRPVPLTGDPATNMQATPAARSGTESITTYAQAKAALNDRGVLWQVLDSAPDNATWRFRCAVPNPRNKALSRVYEARAAEGLDAMRAVLEQIDRDRAP